MDFLKSCSTNVRVLEDVWSLSCAQYRSRNSISEWLVTSQLRETLAGLRARNILCSVVEQTLFVFDAKETSVEEALVHLQYNDAPLEKAKKGRMLLLAVEGALAYTLATQPGVTHLNKWTWIFANDCSTGSNIDKSTVTRLYAGITPAGLLHISTTTHASTLHHVTSSSNEQTVATKCYLAPNGVSVALCQIVGESSAAFVRGEQWQADVLQLLKAEGIELDDNDLWVDVETTQNGELTHFLWPARLCFVPAEPSSMQQVTTEASDTNNWKMWFKDTVADIQNFRDPWASAEEWFTGAAEREKAAEDTHQMEIDPAEEPLPTAEATANLVTSPPFNQRNADQQAALGGIYPTPPDGLLTNHGTQQLPTSDGTSMPAIQEASEYLPDEEIDALRHNTGSSDPPDVSFHRDDDNDLFGDMGEMDFGGNEVDDADFDYFDEPDEEPHLVPGSAKQYAELPISDTHPAISVSGHAQDEEPSDSRTTFDEKSADLIADTPLVHSPSMDIVPAEDAVGSASQADTSDETTRKPALILERPLSPFGIRERLLPPPIPASTIRSEGHKLDSLRRSSNFDPVTFNGSLDLGTRFSAETPRHTMQSSHARISVPDISLPPKTKKPRANIVAPDPDSADSDAESQSSEEDSYESETSVSDSDLPPKLPWVNRKRKRDSGSTAFLLDAGNGDVKWADGVDERGGDSKTNPARVMDLQNLLFGRDSLDTAKVLPFHGLEPELHTTCDTSERACCVISHAHEFSLPSIEQIFEDLEDLDLVYTAQIVSEQTIDSLAQLTLSCSSSLARQDTCASGAIQPRIKEALLHVLPNSDGCELAKLTLPRDPTRQTPVGLHKGAQLPARPPQRSESMHAGPDWCHLPPPHIRVQRHGSTVEMLPPALHFYSELGLSPANGPKDLKVISIVPDNPDLVKLVDDFGKELKLVYEASRFGTWKGLPSLKESTEEIELHNDSTMLVELDDDEMNIVAALREYASACESLGNALAKVGHIEPERTVVVMIVNPFPGQRAHQALCACFWRLYNAYRDGTPKSHRNATRSDIVLRILPCSLIANSDAPVLLTQLQMGALAMEIYDRCPPPTKAAAAQDVPVSLLPLFAAPAVEMAMPIPRRIPFQLSAEPPSDLLHDNSVLHLAYATSADREWMAFCWLDASGKYQTQLSACLRGKSIADVVADAWERTCEILRSRDVTWRVYIVSQESPERSVVACWKSAVAKKPRKQVLSVTLLSAHTDTHLRAIPPAIQPHGPEKSGTMAPGFLTPVTTPSGTGATVSPDASGTIAPPTPVPSDGHENDSDTHLVEIADETWAMLLSTPFNNFTEPALANGMLLRRGNVPNATPEPDNALSVLGVGLHWDVRLWPNGTVDEGQQSRQAESTLREVLRMYRSLALLGRVKGWCESVGRGEGTLPLHLVGVARAVAGLKGFLG